MGRKDGAKSCNDEDEEFSNILDGEQNQFVVNALSIPLNSGEYYKIAYGCYTLFYYYYYSYCGNDYYDRGNNEDGTDEEDIYEDGNEVEGNDDERCVVFKIASYSGLLSPDDSVEQAYELDPVDIIVCGVDGKEGEFDVYWELSSEWKEDFGE
ncbi:MAG: hypothetical protein EZS28_012322 [Streblomastix strix]|uniref:Uncharacterized protein n=1 Tax=Streblomastix strix TaxID=222440 RepID=A0A5J4WBH1_9EUKA|nr:MAG: hypothetical protein EZS28_012322 [Streblomastix strix]